MGLPFSFFCQPTHDLSHEEQVSRAIKALIREIESCTDKQQTEKTLKLWALSIREENPNLHVAKIIDRICKQIDPYISSTDAQSSSSWQSPQSIKNHDSTYINHIISSGWFDKQKKQYTNTCNTKAANFGSAMVTPVQQGVNHRQPAILIFEAKGNLAKAVEKAVKSGFFSRRTGCLLDNAPAVTPNTFA